LAKRTDGLSLRELAARGVTREGVLRWVARRSGWPELRTQARVADLAASFDMRRVPRGPLVCGPGDWSELLS
ncbi:MAG: tRNA glutamyl-Q(34) synthetase GluQRS, partial [Planctomycetia bacterium]